MKAYHLLRNIQSSLLTLSLAVLPPPASAVFGVGDIVYDPANYSQNVLTAVRALQSNLNEAQQIANQLRQIEMEVKNLANFPAGVWADIQADLNQLTQLAQSSGAISYTMQNLSTQFKQLYPGYQAQTNYEQEYQAWTNNSLESIRTALETANRQSQVFEEEKADMRKIENMSDSAEGQMQVLQTGNMLTAQLVEQMQKLRLLQMTEMQAQTAYMATQIQDQAAEKAAIKRWLDSGKNYKPIN